MAALLASRIMHCHKQHDSMDIVTLKAGARVFRITTFSPELAREWRCIAGTEDRTRGDAPQFRGVVCAPVVTGRAACIGDGAHCRRFRLFDFKTGLWSDLVKGWGWCGGRRMVARRLAASYLTSSTYPRHRVSWVRTGENSPSTVLTQTR